MVSSSDVVERVRGSCGVTDEPVWLRVLRVLSSLSLMGGWLWLVVLMGVVG